LDSEGAIFVSPSDFRKEVRRMAKSQATQAREELSGLLTAISIVSKRLAENLKKLSAGKEAAEHGQAEPPG
jgi:hypothetical protein